MYFMNILLYFFIYYYLLVVDPAFWLMRFPLDGELDFLFEKLIFIDYENDLESPLIFVLFFKRVNKIRKKNPKCDSLFWKRRSTKNRIGFGGQVIYREGTVQTVAPL